MDTLGMPIILVPFLGIGLFIVLQSIHRVQEGHVGIYWRGGALLQSYTNPGYNFKMPMVTRYNEVQISIQTDKVVDIPCGTSGGVVIHFGSIEVVNRLNPESVLHTIKTYGINYDKLWIYDKIHHEINQFCSQHTLREVYIDKFGELDEMLTKVLQTDCDTYKTGIEIIALRVTKPRIPQSIRQNYEIMEVERTKRLVATQHKKVVQKMAETERKKELILAKQLQQVSEIEMDTELVVKRGYKTIEQLEDQMQISKSKATADAEYYKMTKMAESNNVKLTKEYLELQLYTAVQTQPKFFFGDVDNMFDIEGGLQNGNSIQGIDSELKPDMEDSLA